MYLLEREKKSIFHAHKSNQLSPLAESAFIPMKKIPKKGDHVTWNSDVGKVTGTVQKKLTTKTSVKKHVVKASKENPQYLVKSDKTGKLAAHKSAAMKKARKK
jgi:hypothetical protein